MPDLQAQEKIFTVVIDAGHGGHDIGAPGATVKEKVINLAVALKLGNLISENLNDVKVIYTRKTDRFIGLDERANIANRNKADLFISIHTNAVEKASQVSGAETYTMGLARSEENLEVAKRENSVILLEEDYQQKYEGFDPNSAESNIMFSLMQNRHMEQSISFASEIQKSFKTAKRNDRGVRQAGLLVLRKTSMPSVLVELGFISNATEERFMKSADGQKKLAKALYDAFVIYKREFDRKKELTATTVTTKKPTEQANETKKPATQTTAADTKSQLTYRVQILASKTKINAGSRQFKGYKNVAYVEDNGFYKYMYGESTNLDSIKVIRKKILPDFKDAFVVPIKSGEKVKQVQ
ncbi:N-acetylmuramoyl-L-alanine amidase [Bacteroidia bacterium]|nr:N-acetylmuramoyl-L-alanine amidase [Bacteroidia bacterium]GHU82890.1 N-acetylmuramoyl-L-alanine amidase [Bacteroidia bacterium]GHV04444.1 N-acetylmuramoyl-L-alanine amidase [Bacteroidia bacterium]